MTHIDTSLKKIGFAKNLQKELSKKEKNHDEVSEQTWQNKTFDPQNVNLGCGMTHIDTSLKK